MLATVRVARLIWVQPFPADGALQLRSNQLPLSLSLSLISLLISVLPFSVFEDDISGKNEKKIKSFRKPLKKYIKSFDNYWKGVEVRSAAPQTPRLSRAITSDRTRLTRACPKASHRPWPIAEIAVGFCVFFVESTETIHQRSRLTSLSSAEGNDW